jgi:hypothetical protein
VPVIDTIIEKINAADAFVPDLTFVAITEEGKHVPNPNVLLEYGYALSAKTHSIMIPVMNILYGPPEKLPFDMGHRRHPLKFDLGPTSTTSERVKVVRRLSKTFEEIFRLMIAVAPTKVGVDNPFPEVKPAREPAFYFPGHKPLAAVGFPDDKQEYQYDGDKAIYLRLFPKSGDGQPRVGRAGLREVFYHRRVSRPMAYGFGGLSEANDYGWITFDPASTATTKAITQGFPTGELWGVNSQTFVPSVYNRYVAAPEQIIGFGVISAEKIYARILENYLELAVQEFKLKLPFIIELGASGLRDVYMGAPHPEASSGHYYGPIRDNTLVRRYELPNMSMQAAEGVLRQYFDELYDLAECSRDEILTDAFVKEHGLARLRGLGQKCRSGVC